MLPNTPGMINIGEEIRKELKRQERSVAWFARQLGIHRTSVYDIFEKSTLDTGQLLLISKILSINFFEILADEYKQIEHKQL